MRKCYLGVLLWGLAVSAHAASVSLIPSFQAPLVGDLVELEVVMDFTDDPTIGGGIDIFYDSSILGFESFAFSSTLEDDPDFRRLPDNLDGELNGLAFGDFLGLSGPSTVGTLTFVALGQGTSMLTMAQNEGPPPEDNPGPFVSATTFLPQDVEFHNASVSVVPLPATFWLLLAAIGSLMGFRYRRVAPSG